MANVTTYKRGDRAPSYGPVTLKDRNGAAVPLSGAENVHMWMKGLAESGVNKNTIITIKTSPMTGVSGGALADDGKVEYEWEGPEGEEPGDLDTMGKFRIEYAITLAPGVIATIPNSDYDEIHVIESLRPE